MASSIPKKPTEYRNVAALASTTVRDRNTSRSMAGASWRVDRRIAMGASTAAAAKEPTTRPLDQPQSPPWVIARARAATAAESSATPTRSGTGPPTIDSGTTRRAAMPATSATGRLTKNAQRHPPASMRTEPSDGPVATASAATPPHIATAWALAAGAVADSSRASEAGISRAAPMAWTTRPAMSSHAEGAMPHSSDPAVKISRPSRKMRRRPERSAILPAPRSSAPNTTL